MTVHGILDTSTVVLLDALDPDDLPDHPLISAVTLAELSVGPLVAADVQEQAARQVRLQQAETDFDPVPFDREAARAYGRVAADLRRAGRKPAARAFDALIAAAALSRQLPVYTCNPADFEGIDGLAVIAVPQPGAGLGDRPADPG